MAAYSVGTEDDPLWFDVYLPTQNHAPIAPHCEAARSVLRQIVEMDDAARAIREGHDFEHNEVLAYISILSEQAANFTYWATTEDNEWTVGFTRLADGSWHCNGLMWSR